MSSWRDTILENFIPNVSRLTLVADPDSLLSEEKLAHDLRVRGFDLIEFTDSIEFRYAYESKYRSIWDRGEHTDLVVILRLHDTELASLPFDLLQAGRKLSFNLGDLFPNLSYPIIESLDSSLLDQLFDAQSKYSPDRMGDNSTMDFVLRHVFGVAAELISNEVELLRALLRLHYSKIQIPPMLSERLVQVLCGHGGFDSWPLDKIVVDEEAFFEFLQERWPIFLRSLGKTNQVRENFSEYGLKYDGPDYLPFDHHDIRVYIDNLFVEGKLMPVMADAVDPDVGSWIRIGILQETKDTDEVRTSRLFEILEQTQPNEESRHSDWTAFSLKLAELSSLVFCAGNSDKQSQLIDFAEKLNSKFAIWLTSHYASLINLPPTNPVMLHHVTRRLARTLENSSSGRAALIVVDGLALDQWVTMRNFVQEQDKNLLMREGAAFAWIPTLTSVSRQSIFSGKPPIYYPASINSTNNEEKLWKQFWEGNGISRLNVAYKRGLGDGDANKVLDELIHPDKTKVVGLVVDKIDKIMHGMQLGAAGMHNQITQWIKGGFLQSLINGLLDYDYDVWLTSDHGNIECKGSGRPSEGVIAETRGERARVYPTNELRSQVADTFSFARQWEPVGLPPNYFPLVASGRHAFVSPGTSLVGHGGIAIEEVIVPFIKIERRTR